MNLMRFDVTKITLPLRIMAQSVNKRLVEGLSYQTVRETRSRIESFTDTHVTLDGEYLKNFEEVLVIGDIHGCSVEYEELVEKAHSTSNSKNPNKILKILVGDLVNKGPHSREVIHSVRDKWSLSTIAVKGNHDDTVVREYDKIRKGLETREGNEWIATLDDNDANFLRNLPYTITMPSLKSIVVHAGFVPVEDYLSKTPLDQMIRLRNLEIIENEITKETSYMPTSDPKIGQGPWSRFWKGPYFVYYGHDAKRRFQQYEFAMGLDTGRNLKE